MADRGSTIAPFTLLRIWSAILLLGAAGLKLASPAWGVPRLDAQLLLVGVETGLGVWLLLTSRPRRARVAIACFFTLFAAVALARWARGESSCGCFGAVRVPPALAAALDIAIVLAAMSVRPLARARCVLPRAVREAAIASCALAAVVAGAWRAPGRGDATGFVPLPDGRVYLRPEQWVGRVVPGALGLPQVFEHGVVAVLAPGCPSCDRRLVSYVNRVADARTDADRLVILQIGPTADDGAVWTAARASLRVARPEAARQWVTRTPAELRVRDRVVLEVR